MPVTICQLRPFRHKTGHSILTRSKLINLLSSIVLATASRTITTFDMLHCVGPGFKSCVPANGTRNRSWTMNLHMHIKFILSIEASRALMTLKPYVVSVDAVSAARISISLVPLIPAESTAAIPITAVGTVTTHFPCLLVVFPWRRDKVLFSICTLWTTINILQRCLFLFLSWQKAKANKSASQRSFLVFKPQRISNGVMWTDQSECSENYVMYLLKKYFIQY